MDGIGSFHKISFEMKGKRRNSLSITIYMEVNNNEIEWNAFYNI